MLSIATASCIGKTSSNMGNAIIAAPKPAIVPIKNPKNIALIIMAKASISIRASVGFF